MERAAVTALHVEPSSLIASCRSLLHLRQLAPLFRTTAEAQTEYLAEYWMYVIRPTCDATLMLLLGGLNDGWFSTLKNSALNWRFRRSVIAVFLKRLSARITGTSVTSRM